MHINGSCSDASPTNAIYVRLTCLEVNTVAEEVGYRVYYDQAQGWTRRILDEVLHAAQPLIQILPRCNVPLHIYVVKSLSCPAVPAWLHCIVLSAQRSVLCSAMKSIPCNALLQMVRHDSYATACQHPLSLTYIPVRQYEIWKSCNTL